MVLTFVSLTKDVLSRIGEWVRQLSWTMCQTTVIAGEIDGFKEQFVIHMYTPMSRIWQTTVSGKHNFSRITILFFLFSVGMFENNTCCRYYGKYGVFAKDKLFR